MSDVNPLWDPARIATPPPVGARCGDCSWRYRGGRGRPVDRCHRHDGARVDPLWTACPAHTTVLACEDCGACCREAFHVVELGTRDPFRRARPALVQRQDGRYVLPRLPNGQCPCLQGDGGSWRCDTYTDRPRSCRDFTLGSHNCLTARRRVGLTP